MSEGDDGVCGDSNSGTSSVYKGASEALNGRGEEVDGNKADGTTNKIEREGAKVIEDKGWGVDAILVGFLKHGGASSRTGDVGVIEGEDMGSDWG